MSLFNELKRRNVFRVGIAYIASAWLMIQVSDVVLNNVSAPEWVFHVLLLFLAVGFPFTLIIAWAFELTPEGLKREREVDRSKSITRSTGRKLDFVIIGVLLAALGYFIWESRYDEQSVASATSPVAAKSIAILPFDNSSADAENAEFFAAGLHDELLTLLSRLGDLKVISRTSVERLDRSLSIPEIGALLGVATVLEGQVQRAGDRLRINVQLINVTQEDHLWATTYDRELSAENVFDVQSDIARTIAEALHSQLSANDEAVLITVPTANTEALDRYLLGRQLAGRNSFDTLKKSAAYFKEATELDPLYAKAWVALAGRQKQMQLTGMIDVSEYIAAAEPNIRRALELDKGLPEAHAQLAMLNWRKGDLEAAEASFRKALELNPGDSASLAAYGQYFRLTGRPQDAIPLLERALVNDPLSVDILFELGKSEMYIGHPEKGIMYSQRILAMDPTSVLGYGGMVQANLWMGRYDLLWPWYLKFFTFDPDDFENWAHMGLYSEYLGNAAWADRYLERALQLGPGEPTVLKCYAQLLVHRGRTEDAYSIANRALEDGLDDRWSSNQVFLRLVRDEALQNGTFDAARDWYQKRHPELFQEVPEITVDNVNAAADLSLLLQRAGQPERAELLVDAALAGYRRTQVPGVHGYLTNIVDVELLAMSGEKSAALAALHQAVDRGWNWAWQWYTSNENVESIRNEPEFQTIIGQLDEQMRIQLEAIEKLPHMGEADLRFIENN